MKKIISMVLCIIMCVSVFSTTAVPALAAGTATSLLKVEASDYAYDTITYTISLSPNQTKVSGVIVQAIYDPAVMKVEDCHPVGSYNNNGEIEASIPGIFTNGPLKGSDNIHSMAFVGNGYTVGSKAEGLYEITFSVISEERLMTTVEFKCVEYITNDNNSSNDIEVADGAQVIDSHTFHTLCVPEVTEVNSYGEDALKVVWTKVAGAENYYLYRADEETVKKAEANGTDIPWEKIGGENGLGNVISYVDNDIEQGTIYYYTVSAENSAGATVYDPFGLEGLNFGSIKSINVTADPAGNGAVIEWGALDGADYYEVYRKLGSADDSGWVFVKKLSGTKYTDTTIGSGEVYNYKVRAFKENGKYSADMIVPAPSFKYIAVPTTEVTNTFDGISIEFAPSKGAESFVIEKKTGTGAFASLVTINASDIEGEKYTYIDEDVTPGVAYTYSIQAFSQELNSVRRELAAVTRLGTTSLNDCYNTTKGVSLSWNTVSGAQEYIVFRKADNTTSYSALTTVKGTSFVDTTARNGYTYDYSVAAKNATGNGDYADNVKTIKFLNAPEIKSVATINEGIKIEWRKVIDDATYTLYRKEAGGVWSEYKTGITDLSYTDLEKDIIHGTKYFYTVKAISGQYESAKDETGKSGMHFGIISEISAQMIEKGAYISWNKLSEADSYNVYRKTTNDTSWELIGNVTTSYYEDENMTSGVAYQYKVNALKDGSVADMVCEPASVRYIAKPTGLVRNVNNGIEIRISEEIKGADEYVIQKIINGSPVEIARIKDGGRLYYVDEDVLPKKTYRYIVYAVAYEKDGLAGVQSFSYETATISRIGAPEITVITNDIPGVYLEWEEDTAAFKYQILRRTEDTGWQAIAYEDDPEYLDLSVDGGVKYYYTIAVVTEDGGTGGYNADGKSITFIETPDLISLQNKYEGVIFEWDSVPGAAGYIVYRRVSGGGWTNLGTVEDTIFVDKQNKTGNKTYIYTVRAVAEDGSRGYYDDGLSVKYIKAPVVTTSNTSSGIKLSWAKISGAKTYYVYRKSGSSWKRIATTTKTSYTDTAVKKKPGKSYTYTVRAVNGSLASPYGSFTCKRLYTPTLSSAKSYKKSCIQVVWKPVSGASGYYVYRKYGKKGWTKIATVKSGKTVKYVDKGAKKGTTYYYTVKAYSGTSTSTYNTKGIKCKDKY